jgi:hypothetical protein
MEIHPSILLFLGSFSLEWELMPLKKVPYNLGKICRVKALSIPKIRAWEKMVVESNHAFWECPNPLLGLTHRITFMR